MHSQKTYVDTYANIVLRYRWPIIIGCLIVFVLSIGGATRLGVNTDLRIFFSEDNPQLKAFEALENTYTKNDNVFIAVSSPDKSIFNNDTLAILERLTTDLWKIPYSQRVDSITNFQHSYAVKDDLVVRDLVRDSENLTEIELENIQNIALAEPLLINRLISPNAEVTGINVDVIKPEASENSSQEIALHVMKLVERYKKDYPNHQFHLTGWVMLDYTMGDAAERDMNGIIPLMFALLIIIMLLFLRSLPATFSTIVVIVFSMAAGMGLAGWMGVKITGPSSAAPPIILTLALADSIHLIVTIFNRMRKGDSRESAIVASLRSNMAPVFITSATTLLGFLSMNYSDAPPFRDLGNIVATGVGAAFIYSVTILPATLSLILPKTIKPAQSSDIVGSLIARFSDFVIKHSKTIFWASICTSALLLTGLGRIELNDDFIRYFDERYSYRVDSEFVMDNLTGLYTIEYSLESGKSKGIHEPEFLKHVEAFETWFKEQPEVSQVNSLIPIIKKLNMNMHDDDQSYYALPDDPTFVAQYLLLFELSLPFGMDLNNQINVDKSSLRFIVSLTDITANEVREIDERARLWLSSNTPDHMHTFGTGLAMMYAHLSERNIKSMLWATFIALVLISCILTLAFRSLKYGALSLIPNLIPPILAFGVWGFTVGRIGIPASVLVSLAIGIVVDDTVHFISKYLHAKRVEGLNAQQSVKYAFETVGSAIFVTTVILVVGFSILSFSGYKPNYDMGIMTGIIISVALLFDFLFLPTLLLKIDGNSKVLVKENINENNSKNRSTSDSVISPSELSADGR